MVVDVCLVCYLQSKNTSLKCYGSLWNYMGHTSPFWFVMSLLPLPAAFILLLPKANAAGKSHWEKWVIIQCFMIWWLLSGKKAVWTQQAASAWRFLHPLKQNKNIFCTKGEGGMNIKIFSNPQLKLWKNNAKEHYYSDVLILFKALSRLALKAKEQCKRSAFGSAVLGVTWNAERQ